MLLACCPTSAATNRPSPLPAQILAKELARTKRVVTRLHNSRAQLFDVQTSIQEQAAMLKVAGTLSQSTRIMHGMSRLLKISEIQQTAREMAKGETRRDRVGYTGFTCVHFRTISVGIHPPC